MSIVTRPGQLPQRLDRFVAPLAIVGAIVVWEIVGRVSGALFFPPISEIATAWIELAESGDLLEAAGASLHALVIGFSVGLILGLVVGALMGLHESFRYLLDVYVNVFMAAPLIALIPLIAIVLGLDVTARAFFVFLFAFFPVVVNTEAGIRDVDPAIIEMAHSFGMGPIRRFMTVSLPNALPAIMAGIRVSLVRSISGIITAEIFMALTGFGALVAFYGSQFRPPELFAVIMTVVVVAAGAGSGLSAVTGYVGRWQQGLRRD